MAVIVPFALRQPRSPKGEELDLLNCLRGSYQICWHSGGALPGATHGVALVKGDRLLGTWSYGEHGFTYWPVGKDIPSMQVWTVHAAHQYSVALLAED